MDASQVAVLDLATGTWKTVIRGGRQEHYTASGHLVYVAGNALMAIAFDLARLETRGTASVLVPEVLTLPTGAAEFDVAENGTLLYASGQALAPERTLVWVDRNGREETIAGAPNGLTPSCGCRRMAHGWLSRSTTGRTISGCGTWHAAR